MQLVIEKITAFKGSVFRNMRAIESDNHAFDDLSNSKAARKFAFNLSLNAVEKSVLDAAHFNAIDYIFKQSSWESSRFSDGSYAAWYGSAGLETTFHESAFHWHRKYIQSPTNFANSADPIIVRRSVYSVRCDAILIDLRDKALQFPELNDKDLISYSKTQPIGKHIRNQGLPGIISPSSRDPAGENLTIFKPEVLAKASYEKDYFYTFYPHESKIVVSEKKSTERILQIMLSN